ncbi:mannose-1-phosphate guanylyltransferase [Pelodictyon luteolum]|nr:mannose-1-phosphate guanylyltransferase [Pelodictyon luteolum]
MAGGTERELWPMSRSGMLKPFLDLFGDGPMIQNTIRRAARIARMEHVLVVTDGRGRDMLLASGVIIDPENIIVEPYARGTATCIALGAAHVRKRDPDGVLVVMPSDHVILDEDAFQGILHAAIGEARRMESLVTIGIRPKSPEIVYGYIQAGEVLERPDAGDEGKGVTLYRVRIFAEKPDLATAIRFLESRDFYWNSGIFAADVETLFEAYRRCLPDLYRDMLSVHDAIGTRKEELVVSALYSWSHPASIDMAIMEKTGDIVLLTGEFGWHDPGSWDEVAALITERTVFSGEVGVPGVVAVGAENNFVIKPGGKVVAVVGASELIIIDTPDALLVCGREASYRVGEAVHLLRREGFEEHL